MDDKLSRLEYLSQHLNSSSDSLTEAIERVEKKLAFLRLGVTAFVDEPLETLKCTNVQGDHTYHYNLAYTKGDNGWGLVIWMCDEENSVKEEVTLLQAPRERRIKALHKLPALLQQLEWKAEAVFEEVEKARAIAESI